MVDDEDDEAAETEAAVQRALQERERERLRAQRKRARCGPNQPGESGVTSSDSTAQVAAAGGAGGADGEAEAEADAAAEAERARDLAERDEFAERLRQRDLAKTRKLGDDALAVVGRREEEQKLLKANEDERGALLHELRKVSRQVYLEKREKQKLEEARDDVRDEEYLFGDVELTGRERRERELKKRLYELAHERVNLSDKVDRYQMPTAYDDMEAGTKQDERFGGMMARYQEEEGEEMNEFQAWDATQIKRSTAKVGATDRRAGQMGEGSRQDYELVMATDEQIEFIADEIIAGNLGEADAAPAKKPSQKETLAEVRRSLPVFPYREQIIQAVKAYQCLIIVGETGSGKTTQIPQYLYEAGFCDNGKKVGCTQPRRVAAMSVAARVAQEVGCKLGNEVRFAADFGPARPLPRQHPRPTAPPPHRRPPHPPPLRRGIPRQSPWRSGGGEARARCSLHTRQTQPGLLERPASRPRTAPASAAPISRSVSPCPSQLAPPQPPRPPPARRRWATRSASRTARVTGPCSST
eukprot:scaffold4687_cov117-Isochrysis_galbana.AAC.8